MAEFSLDNTAKAFDLFGKEVIKRARRNLKIKRKVDGKYRITDNTGKLGKSLAYKITRGSKGLNLKFISSLDYANFIEKGVKGRESTYSSVNKYKPKDKNPAQFKKKNLAKGVVEKWVRSPKIKLRDKDGKFIQKNDSNIKSASYMIGKSIAEKGIGARSYMKDAIEESKKRFILDLKKGLLKDLTTNLTIE